MNTRKPCLLFVSLFVLSHINASALGVIAFNNIGAPADGRIYRGDWALNNGELQLVSWQPCSGATFHAALYWGPAGAISDAGLVQVGAPGSFVTGVAAGIFFGGNRTLSTPLDGPVLSFQVRAWEGTAPNYELALSPGYSGIAGKGPIIQMDTKDPNDVTEVPPIIGKSPQWQGFIFGPDGMTVLIPEPSTVGIAVLGLSALLLRVTPISRSPRRRSQGT